MFFPLLSGFRQVWAARQAEHTQNEDLRYSFALALEKLMILLLKKRLFKPYRQSHKQTLISDNKD